MHAGTESRRVRIEIEGAVQGVGFRPFAYRLGSGVVILGSLAGRLFLGLQRGRIKRMHHLLVVGETGTAQVREA